MSNARSWLPPGTCFERVDRQIASLVREWGHSWFGDDDFTTAAGASSRAQFPAAVKSYPCGSRAWLAVPNEAITAVGRCALRIEPASDEAQADRALFETIGETCLMALCEMLVRELSLNDARNGDAVAGALMLGENIAWAISCASLPVRFEFVMSEVERIELLLRLLPAPHTKAPPVSPEVALAPHEVGLAARLGTCGVTVAELRSLALGDVLVLDRDLAAPLPLVVDGAPTPGGSGTVARQADKLVLEIAEPISGRRM